MAGHAGIMSYFGILRVTNEPFLSLIILKAIVEPFFKALEAFL